MRDDNGDGIPDLLGQEITVSGILTGNPYSARNNTEIRAFLQDNSGAIRLVTSDLTMENRLKLGDRVRVSGKIEQYQGMEQLRIQTLERLGTGVPEAINVPVSELIGEKHSGKLIRVSGELIVPSNFLENLSDLRIRDRSGEIRIYLPTRLRRNPEFTSRLIKGGSVELIGNLEQYHAAPPYNAGYRILPRTTDDFHFGPDIPYRAIAFAIALTILILVFPGLVIYSSLRRRVAEQHAIEMSAVAENLRKSEEALRSSEERYRRLFEQNPHPMWVCDRHTLSVLAVNPAALSHYGYSEKEFLSMTLSDIQAPEENPLESPGASEDANLDLTAVSRYRKKDGSFLDVEVTVRPVDFGGKPELLVLAEDVTEHKKMEEELRQAQRLEAVGRLAGGIAHDFNNLLTVILGVTDLLYNDRELSESRRAEVREINQAASTAATLTAQLLAFSRQQVLVPQVLNLNTIVAETERILRRTIGEDITLVIQLEPALECVKVDRGQVEQVLLNLIVNSRDAMPSGGELVIRTSNSYLEINPENQSAAIRPGRYVKLTVRDNGSGMDPDTRGKIFEPFFTTKEKGKGTGLGLATVYGIVKQSKGYISVDSKPGTGTNFEIYFPVAEQTESHLETSRSEAVTNTGGSETILVVEDEHKVRKLASAILQRHGYGVLEASDGETALRIADSYAGPISLLLTDVVMPGMSGQEVSRRIRVKRPGMRVLYVSGYTKADIDPSGAVASGAFLQKPYTSENLAHRVRKILDSAGESAGTAENPGGYFDRQLSPML